MKTTKENLAELKNRFRKCGINLNFVKRIENKQFIGLEVNYYTFSEKGNYRSKNKVTYFNSDIEIEAWISTLEENN